VLVINKSDINKSVINREINVYSAAITGLILIGGLVFGGLIFGWAYIRGGAYIWNEVSVSTCGGLIHGGEGLYWGWGLIVGGLRYILN
jgi:hypothetical protein